MSRNRPLVHPSVRSLFTFWLMIFLVLLPLPKRIWLSTTLPLHTHKRLKRFCILCCSLTRCFYFKSNGVYTLFFFTSNSSHAEPISHYHHHHRSQDEGPVSTRDNRVLKGPLGRSLRSFARTAHSTNSLRSALLRYARFARPLRSWARSLTSLNLLWDSEIHKVAFTL